MNMKLFVFTSLLSFTFLTHIACSTKKNATPVAVNEHLSSSIKLEKNDSLFASLERGYCFGKCPVYKVEIYTSGYAVYTGKANTEKIGVYTSKFTKDQLNTLTTIAKEINYMSLNDVYDSPITDLPSHTTSIAMDGKRKVVLRRHNYPESIVTFEQQIDQLVEGNEWKFVKKLEDNQ